MTQPAFTVSAILTAVKSGATGVWEVVARDVAVAEQAIVKTIGPEVSAFVGAEVSIAKQYASDMISLGDGWLASHAAIVATMVEQTIDTELALATKGASTGFNKLTNQGVDELVNAAIAAAHNVGLAIKAKLAASAVQPTQAPMAQNPVKLTLQGMNANPQPGS